MVALFMLITVLCIGRIAAQQDPRCGQANFSSATGWFTSPLYPSTYPDNIQCEWLIQTAPGTVIEIEFDDFNVAHPLLVGADRTDFVLIFDTDDGSTRKYVDNVFDQYLSYSNSVTVRFVSDNRMNDAGFNLTYRSRDANSCDKNDLWFDDKIDIENTRCVGQTFDEYYTRCFVRCNDQYMLRSSSRITCRNGRFQPDDPCQMISWEVQLCEMTNLMYCRYSTSELRNYWSKSSDTPPPLADPSEYDEFNLDIFPDPQAAQPPEVLGFIPPGRAGAGGSTSPIESSGIETKCIDNLLKYSYCTRKKKKNKREYAFSCLAFLKIKKLKESAAERRMNACFQCRAVDCTSVVYI